MHVTGKSDTILLKGTYYHLSVNVFRNTDKKITNSQKFVRILGEVWNYNSHETKHFNYEYSFSLKYKQSNS